jgi:hypothetical protein
MLKLYIVTGIQYSMVSGENGLFVNPYRRPSIDASYQVLDHLDKRFQRRRFKCEKLMDAK